MSLDLQALGEAVEAHGTVVRVVVAAVDGSAPREPGAAMLVWRHGQAGTIGGGALEWQASERARAMLSGGPGTALSRQALGPALGQCCGGAVVLGFERFDARALRRGRQATEHPGIYARAVEAGAPAHLPEPLARIIEGAAEREKPLVPSLHSGWLAEALWRDATPVWIYGAGHVGRAVAGALAPLPQFAVTLIDTAPERLPDPLPAGVTPALAANPADLVAHAPESAHHLIMTMSHGMDLDICHRLLSRPFTSAGLIGSASKWVRFRKRLQQLGAEPAQIARITCPIGDPALGKDPHAIAVGVAHALLLSERCETNHRHLHQITGMT